MPRPNRRRTIASEANLARRIAFERERRGLSYDALAKLMTDAGCSMQGSAIFRIEKGEPPRRVTVDELVTFGEVLELSIDDLLMPLELFRKKRARRVVEKIEAASAAMVAAAETMRSGWVELERLALDDAELSQYAHEHLAGGDWSMMFDRIGESVGQDKHIRERVTRAVQTIVAAMQWAAAAEVNPAKVSGTRRQTRKS
jgi:transcriptional regulator with XRE-family HTH domain